jgi:ankyrin repeat protein
MKNTLRFGQGPALVGAAVLMLTVQLLPAQAAAKKAEVVDMGAFKVSVPPGGGWKTDADPESGEVSFSKVKGKGILTALITQGKGVVRVTAVTVIPELLEPHRWRMTEEEAADACVDTYVSESGPDQRGLGKLLDRGATDVNGKKLFFAKWQGPAASPDPSASFEADHLIYLYFPPDFRKTHRFFHFQSSFFRPDALLKPYGNPGSEPVLAVIDSLEIVDPDQAAPGVDGELIRAAAAGDLETARLAIERGAKPDAAFGASTALGVAAFHGRREIVELLLERGADINKRGEETGATPLLQALFGMEPDLAGFLVERGAAIDGLDRFDFSPLMYASATGHVELVSKLLERGADVGARNARGATPLLAAVGGGSLEVLRILIDKGADINAQMAEGWSPLMEAIDLRQPDIVRMLVDGGADVNLRTETGSTALMTAVYRDDPETARFLIEKGADVNAETEKVVWYAGRTALLQAVLEGKYDLAKLLVGSGADVNIPLTDGRGSALIKATEDGRADMVKLLIEKGADVNAKKGKKQTALAIATKNKYTEIVGLLRAAGAK